MSNGELAGARRELQPRGAGPAGACPGRAGWDKFLHGAMEPVLHVKEYTTSCRHQLHLCIHKAWHVAHQGTSQQAADSHCTM